MAGVTACMVRDACGPLLLLRPGGIDSRLLKLFRLVYERFIEYFFEAAQVDELPRSLCITAPRSYDVSSLKC